jgi:hypothetical protein
VSWQPTASSSTVGPSVAIVLSLEAPPRIHTFASSNSEANRLADWILSQADLVALIDQALLSLERRRREAA